MLPTRRRPALRARPGTSRSTTTRPARRRRTDVGGGLPLVMLHGGGPGASAWSNFGARCRGFAASFRTLLVDQPGFGGSDKPPVVGNYYRFAADHVVALLDELGIERVHLLGNSLGGGTAMRLALSHPDRVGRLVLMGPGGLSLNLFHADPTEGVQRLMDFGAEPDPRVAARVHLDDGGQPGAGHRRARRGAVRRRDRARAPGTRCARWACRSGTPRPPRTACSGARRTGCASTPC